MDSPMPPDTESRIAEKVVNSPYASPEEVMGKALTLLDAYEAEQAEKLAWLKNVVPKGIDSRRPKPIDWDAFWEDVKKRTEIRQALSDVVG